MTTANKQSDEELDPEVLRLDEDVPLFQTSKDSEPSGIPDSSLDSMNSVTRTKYRIGEKALFLSMAAMILFVLGDVFMSLADIDTPLIESAFDAFKLICMTVLGYIFGSASTND